MSLANSESATPNGPSTSSTTHHSLTDADKAIARRLDFWNSQLLDLSKRNRLLYFNPAVGLQTRAPHGIRCVEPGCEVLWNRLARRGKTQRFVELDSEFEQALSETEWEEENDEDAWAELILPTIKTPGKDEIRTEPAAPRLGRLLTNLRSRARVSFDEGGIVTLFMAFGFLRWSESQDSQSESYAPLLLVPIELIRASPREPYQLKRQDEEVLLNPALRYKLESDFGIVLPEAPSLDDKSLLPYWEKVQAALDAAPIASQDNWGVLDWVYLGVFSFHKMAMFRDLRENRALLSEHPFVRALSGDAHAQVNPSLHIPKASELDQLPTAEMELVMDADSSQHEAIIAARRGLSFVLQGPPGTGKSQTITNIIAECLEAGKTVLFVSEKMAALEVVHRRLKAVGLGDFCLEAHSHKANKRAIITELARTLRLPRFTASPTDIEDEELDRLRAALNAYVTELHRPHEPSHTSPHTAVAQLTIFQDAPHLEFEFPNPTFQTFTSREALSQWLEELERLDSVWRLSSNHPWHGLQMTDTGLPGRQKLRSSLSEAAQKLRELSADWNTRCQQWRLHRLPSLHSLQRLLALGSLVEIGQTLHPTLVAQWLTEGSLESRRSLALEHSARWQRLKIRRDTLEAQWKVLIFELDAPRLRQNYEAAKEWLHLLGGADTALQKRQLLEKHFAAITRLQEAARLSHAIAKTLGLETANTLTDINLTGIRQRAQAAHFTLKQTQPLSAWFAPGALSELETRFETARRHLTQSRQLENQLSARWHIAPLLALPCEELAERFQTQYTNFFARWSRSFRADRNLLQSTLRSGQKLELPQIVAELRLAMELKALKQWDENENTTLSQHFGAHWQNDATDWNTLQNALGAARELSTFWDEHVPPNVVDFVMGTAAPRELLRERAQELHTIFTALQDDLKHLFGLFITRQLPFTELPFTDAPFSNLQAWLATGQAQLEVFFAALDQIGACAHEKASFSVAERFTALDEAEFIRRETSDLASAEATLRAAFGPLFQRETTSWETILKALDWAEAVRAWFGAIVPQSFLAILSDDTQRGAALYTAQTWHAQLENLRLLLNHIASQFGALSFAGVSLEQADFAIIASEFEAKIARFSQLDEWLAYQNLQSRARELGLSRPAPERGFWEEVHLRQEGGNAPQRSQIAAAFWKRFWTLWLDEAVKNLPILNGFQGDHHDIAAARFRRLDTQSQHRARERLRVTLSGKKPFADFNTPHTGQLGILGREAVKKTRQMPIRALFEQTAAVVQALKPCMLMSPLSVAQFLPPQKVKFDLVIFDEASQIAPADAIGAIARGTQVIVVGDNQQMPPSNFFSSGETGEGDEWEDGNSNLESILNECLSVSLPQKKLLWHYRSRHEELIAFSNRHFYENELLTFPSPHIATAASSKRALSWERIEGFYTPGTGSNSQHSQTNRIEAEHVAQLAIAHARTSPEQSLGIITFNEPQRRLIEAEIYRLTAADPALDTFFWAPRPGGFFVKALENVQGDERDVILFSVGFGPRRAQNGTIAPMRMNFGPLGRKGGERRLNVAITRARRRVHIITSFEPEQIDLTRAKSEGARTLKAYLEWAREHSHRRDALNTSRQLDGARQSDSIAASLAKTLQEAGWKTHVGIGLGEYRVDVGIEDPNEPGRMLLGIMCDGISYRRAATARDRDRLRPQMLTSLGWHLHHLWSPDWAKSPERELQKVLEALRSAHAAKSQPQALSENTSSEYAVYPSEEPNSSIFLAPETAMSETSEVTDETVITVQMEATPEDAAVFEPTVLIRRGEAESFYIQADLNTAPILEALVQVVNGEGPVNELVAARRIVAAWDISRAGAKIQEIIARIAMQGARQNLFHIKYEPELQLNWYWPRGMESLIPRRPGPNGERHPDEVPLEEICEVAVRVLAQSYGIEPDELSRLIAHFFGWKPNGIAAQNRLQHAFARLKIEQRLFEKNGTYVVRM